MNKEEIIWALDFLKIYTAQKEEFRTKFVELLESINKELNTEKPSKR